jgi:phage terminase large subunit-like protein
MTMKKKTRSVSSPDPGYGPPPASLFVDPTTRPEYVPGFVWDEEAADKPRRFIEKCCRHRVEGGQVVKVSPIPWFRDRVLYPLFGWRRSNGRARFRRFSVFVPKKNRKTTSCSQLVQFSSVVAGMDVFLAANVKDQARTMWRMVRDSIQESPILDPLFDVVDHKYLIRNKRNGKEIRCLSADAKVSEGINGLILLDEIHSFTKPDLVDAIMYATRGIPNAIIGSISTAGDNRNGVGWEWWQATEMAINTPAANPGLLGVIFAADEKDDEPSDPAVWYKANPALGDAFTEDEFRSDYEDALTHPRKFSKWLRYSLNIWTAPDSRWFDPDEVAACVAPPPEPLDSRPCWVGLDLADHNDLTAAAFLFRSEDGTFDVDILAWVPQEAMVEREKRDYVPYSTWVREGWLRVTEGNSIDHEQIHADIMKYLEAHPCKKMGADPWKLEWIGPKFQSDGIDIQKVGQQLSYLTGPSKTLEDLISGKRLRFESPVLLWCLNNASVWRNINDDIRPDKSKSREKIDAAMALINALAVASTDAPDEGGEFTLYAL